MINCIALTIVFYIISSFHILGSDSESSLDEEKVHARSKHLRPSKESKLNDESDEDRSLNFEFGEASKKIKFKRLRRVSDVVRPISLSSDEIESLDEKKPRRKRAESVSKQHAKKPLKRKPLTGSKKSSEQQSTPLSAYEVESSEDEKRHKHKRGRHIAPPTKKDESSEDPLLQLYDALSADEDDASADSVEDEDSLRDFVVSDREDSSHDYGEESYEEGGQASRGSHSSSDEEEGSSEEHLSSGSDPSSSAHEEKAHKKSVVKFPRITRASRHKPPAPNPFPVASSIKDESDEEIPEEHNQSYLTVFPGFPKEVIEHGVLLKFLANVYLRNLDQTANVFIPKYILEVKQGDTWTVIKDDFFRTSKGQICGFASGGIHHVWEKTVGHVFKSFFDFDLKIIRSGWMSKHLYKDKGITKNFRSEFKGREEELHSEYYYDLYVKEFFMPDLLEQLDGNSARLTINAFSWWDACNSCETLLTKHRTLFAPKGITISYHIAAKRRYKHWYPTTTAVHLARIMQDFETPAWTKLWAKVTEYSQKTFPTSKAKKQFWTKTKQGLEICKWLGQAFVENTVTLAGRTAIPGRKGDILRLYAEMAEEETEELRELLDYLREKNWDLSCWYRQNYPSPVQRVWKRNWDQFVMPHFGWEDVNDYRQEEPDECQMCGNPDVLNMHWIFHPKFRVSDRFLKRPKEEQKMNERSHGYTIQTSPDELPEVLLQKRRQSLCVGSECVKVLTLTKEEIEKWREEHPDDVIEDKRLGIEEREQANELIDDLERSLRKNKAASKLKNKESK